MHYYIDGYNLLFYIKGFEGDLATARQELIEELNTKAKALDLHITLVFDSHYQPGESSRSHYAHLEILFSAHGETADDLILEDIKLERHPVKKTVVTSDKKLAWYARRCAAKTETVAHFLEWLEKRYKNKLRHQGKQAAPPAPIKKVESIRKPKNPSPLAKPEECADFYLEQFQKRFETVEQFTPKPKVKPVKADQPETHRPKLKQGKQKITASDFDRWHKIFERDLHPQEDEL